MAKSGYKKFKKQEKAKVKFKGNKTLLPKGQNVTDTNFKVKKIIVKGQLKEHGAHELLTKKNLNIKELIARLSHHNAGMRQEAVSGLKELVMAHGSALLQGNLTPLLQATMALTVDREGDVRADTLKLLTALFEKISEAELSPLFPMVVCHLTCAMTHIEPAVRADSLRLLDTLLATLPELTAAHTSTLLPHCLDLISQRAGGGSDQARSLSLSLDGKITSEKWRARVIGRLNRLFSIMVHYCRKDHRQKVPSVRWSNAHPLYLGLYVPILPNNKQTEDVTSIPMKEYAEMLMPLLLDTFIEAVPKQDNEDGSSACVIGLDVAALLQSIVEVILHIWNLLKLSSQPESLTEWFLETWGKKVASRLLQGRFPYSIAAANCRKRQRNVDQVLAVLQARDPEATSSLLNLQLCLLTFLLSRPGDLWKGCIQYIRQRLRGSSELKPEETAVLCQCLEAASEHPSLPDTPSLLSVLAKCDILNGLNEGPVNRRAFDILTSVALKPSHHLHEDEKFTAWLDSLPALLCWSFVPLSTVKGIVTIATRGLPAFKNSLDGWIEAILNNLPVLKVLRDKDKEGPKLVVNLLYWVTDWDEGLVETIRQLIHNKELNSDLTGHLEDVLRLKLENTEDCDVKELIRKVLS